MTDIHYSVWVNKYAANMIDDINIIALCQFQQ